VCSNGTRVFVHQSVRTEFLKRLAKRVSAMKIGDPMDPATQVGSLISEDHMQMVLGWETQTP
jgi:betaine-aldehyde dehydrogenase